MVDEVLRIDQAAGERLIVRHEMGTLEIHVQRLTKDEWEDMDEHENLRRLITMRAMTEEEMKTLDEIAEHLNTEAK